MPVQDDKFSEDALASLGAFESIRTSPQGNWFIPQDAQLRARGGIGSRIEDWVLGSEPGRRLMSAVDQWNALIGSPLENVSAPGASHAITPALEALIGEGKITRVPQLLGGERGYFMDRMGDIYDLGQTYSGGLVHPEVMDRILPKPLENWGMQATRSGLADLDLMRIRQTRGITGLEMTRMPSNAEMEQLIGYFEKFPKQSVSLSLSQPGPKPRSLEKAFGNSADAIQAIYDFFQK